MTAMKSLKLLISLLSIFMALPACQKEAPLPESQASPNTVQLEQRQKKHPVPFHAAFISQVVTIPPQPNPEICPGENVLHIDQTLSGNATHLGNISGTISSCADVSTNPATIYDVKIVFEAANGDLLYFEGSSGSFEITGGTGRFDDATGSVTGGFTPIGQGRFDSYLDGEIQY